jgi:hypothetical protein
MDYHCNLSYIWFCWWSLMYQRLDSCPTSWWSYTNGSWEMANMSYRGFLYISQWLGLLISQKSKVFLHIWQKSPTFSHQFKEPYRLIVFFLKWTSSKCHIKAAKGHFFPAPSGLGMQQLLLVKLGASFVVFSHNLVIRKVLQRSPKDAARISRSWGSKSYDWLTTQEEKSWSFREHQKMWPHNANSSQVTLAWQVCFQGWSWKKLNLVMTILAT